MTCTLLVFGEPPAERVLRVPGFTVLHAPDADAALRCILEGDVDCVLVCCHGALPRGTERLQQACEDHTVPIVLALEPAAGGVDAPLEALAADGIVDWTWPAPLLAQALRAAIQRVLVGRNLADIHRRVLDATEGHVHTLQALAFRDELTGLFNLRCFRSILSREHARSIRHGHSYALLQLDMDNLRELNTRHGHPAGSRMLGELGKVLTAHTRASNFAFRVGGDEFALLLVETQRAGALTAAGRVREAVASLVVVEQSAELRTSVSVGVAVYPADGTCCEDVIANADRALYRAKALGRNRVVCFDDPR